MAYTLTDGEGRLQEIISRMMAIQLLIQADKHELNSTIEDLKNMHLLNRNNQYLKMLHVCHVLLKGW